MNDNYTFPGDVLFAPGKADLKESAKATLNKIANAVKKDYGGKRLLVQGYTDRDPIARTKDKWEVMSIEYKDNNKSPVTYSSKGVAALVDKFNRVK